MLSKAFRTSIVIIQARNLKTHSFSTVSGSRDCPRRVVFISQSTNVFSNLAFEDWLYRNWNFSKRSVLFLWRNSPCVVVGRHQNPYIEANLDYLDSAHVPVVRRNSGGGTVYHDDGNLNCTFFTSRERYNRKENLNLICKALKNDFNILAQVNKKDDILIGYNLKVSGTAAKLGRLCAYHHCTLLISTDKLQLKLALRGDKTMKSKATESITSHVTNLQEYSPGLSVEKVLGSVARTYLEEIVADGSGEPSRLDGFTLINPSEDWFPGLKALEDNLNSWDWLHGMTPAFKVTRPVALGREFYEGSDVLLTVEVKRGMVQNVSVDSSVGHLLKSRIEEELAREFFQTRFTPDFFHEVEVRLMEEDVKPHLSKVH